MVLGANQIDQTKKLNQAEQSDNSAVAQELRKIDDLKRLQQQMDAKAYDQIAYDAKRLESLRSEKGYHAKLQKDAGVKVLSELAKDLAKIGIDLTPKPMTKFTASKIELEMENILNRTSQNEDKYDVKNNLTREAVARSDSRHEQQKHEQGKKDARQLASSPEVREAMQDYSGAYAQFALAASPEAREKLEDAQERLKRKGFSDREIISLEKAVKRSFRTQFVSQIQDSFIQHMFSPKNTLQFVVTSRQLNESFEQAIDAQGLSGISADPQSIKDEMSRVTAGSHDELRDFVRDAVESKLMEKHISCLDNKEELKKFVELGKRVGFNFSHFIKTWEQKKFDLGLFVLEVNNAQQMENRGEIAIGEVSSSGVSDKHGYEMTKDEERELLINQIRAEFMKRAITGDPLAMFSFAPKIRKLKNGLIKLGLVVEDFSRIEKEAKVLARYRTLEMLREAFIERSTYYELSGPAFGLLKNKIKGLVSNLDSLDMPLSKDQLDIIRDEANRMMHDHAIIELKSAIAILENGENPAVEQKLPLMVKLIQRLREESGFSHGVGEDIDDVLVGQTGLNGVKEHA